MEMPEFVQQSEMEVEDLKLLTKKPFVEPRFEWIEPELTAHGKVETVASFFGTFSP